MESPHKDKPAMCVCVCVCVCVYHAINKKKEPWEYMLAIRCKKKKSINNTSW